MRSETALVESRGKSAIIWGSLVTIAGGFLTLRAQSLAWDGNSNISWGSGSYPESHWGVAHIGFLRLGLVIVVGGFAIALVGFHALLRPAPQERDSSQGS